MRLNALKWEWICPNMMIQSLVIHYMTFLFRAFHQSYQLHIIYYTDSALDDLKEQMKVWDTVQRDIACPIKDSPLLQKSIELLHR